MGSRWPNWAAVVPVVAFILSAGGASEAAAQRGSEVGAMGVVTASDPALVIAGAYAALPTSRRTRLSAAAGLGASDGDAAWRGELLAHFLLSPGRRRGVGLYGAGGVAVVGGPVEQGYVVLTLGLDSRPAGGSGWFAEAGVGGGVRLATGYRWRFLHRAGEVP